MIKTIVLKDSLSSTTTIHTPITQESTHPVLCLKNIQLLANFFQAALDLAGIPYYKTIKLAKQPLYFINAQEYLIHSSKTNKKEFSLEHLFNKVHAAVSLVLIPTLMMHEGLTSLKQDPAPPHIQTICASIAPYALTTLMTLGFIKSALKIKKLKECKASNMQKKHCDLTQCKWWLHKHTLAICEGVKLSLNITKLLTPAPYLQLIKTCYNLTMLANSTLNACKHYNDEHKQPTRKDLTTEQLFEILETLIKQAPTSHLDVKEPIDDFETGAVTKT